MVYFFERVARAFSFIWEAVKMAFRDKDLLIPSALSILANFAYVALIIVILNAANSLWLIGWGSQDIEDLKAAGRLLRDGPGATIGESLEERIAEEKRLQEEAVARGEDPEEFIRRRRAELERERAEAAAAKKAEEEKAKSRRYWQAIFNGGALFGAILITYIFSGMTVSLVYDHLSGKDARIGEAARVVMNRLAGLVLLAVVSTIVSIIASMARGRRGEKNPIGAVVGGIIESVWTVASFLILPGMIIHRLLFW